MASVVEQLVDMGFEKERAEFAFKQTGSAGLEVAIEWLMGHEGVEIPKEGAEAPAPAANTEGGAEAAVAENTPGSYKCNDCGKIMRDENAMMFHASKSKHENFSESTETIAPLTEEEKAQKALELRDRIRAARHVKEENEKKEQIEKEKRRREEGKLMAERREQQKDAELKAIVDERKRAKTEEQMARQRVLDQIKRDKEDRLAKQTGIPVVEPTPTKATAPVVKTDYTQATLQIRLPSGQAVKNCFEAKEQLSAVRLWLQLNHNPDGGNFNLLVPFPRKLFSEDDYDRTLTDLGLVPSAAIVMTR